MIQSKKLHIIGVHFNKWIMHSPCCHVLPSRLPCTELTACTHCLMVIKASVWMGLAGASVTATLLLLSPVTRTYDGWLGPYAYIRMGMWNWLYPFIWWLSSLTGHTSSRPSTGDSCFDRRHYRLKVLLLANAVYGNGQSNATASRLQGTTVDPYQGKILGRNAGKRWNLVEDLHSKQDRI